MAYKPLTTTNKGMQPSVMPEKKPADLMQMAGQQLPQKTGQQSIGMANATSPLNKMGGGRNTMSAAVMPPETGNIMQTPESAMRGQQGNFTPWYSQQQQIPTPTDSRGLPSNGGYTFQQQPWMQTNSLDDWRSQGLRDALQNYSQLLPFQQLEQNKNQYNTDFNENQRRWNNQFNWQQQGDTFNMGLANRQQGMSENIANWQQQNWGKQFGLDQEMGRGQLQLGNKEADYLRQFQQGQLNLGNTEAANLRQYQQGQLTNEQRGQDFQRQYQQGQLRNDAFQNQSQRDYQQGQLQLGGREAEYLRQYQQGQLRNDQFSNQSQRQYQQGQLQLGNREAGMQDWYNRANIDVSKQQNTIDQMWKSGQLTNQQRELALGELTQKQNNAFKLQELTQQGALTREGYQSQQDIARMNAFGRTQTPNARWVRSW